MQNWQAKDRVNRSTTIILSVYGQTGPKGYLGRGIARLPLDPPILFFARRWESNSQSIQHKSLILEETWGILLRLIWADGIRVQDKNWILLWSCNRLFFFWKMMLTREINMIPWLTSKRSFSIKFSNDLAGYRKFGCWKYNNIKRIESIQRQFESDISLQ